MDTISKISADVVACERCPRLRQWCLQVAREKKREFREWDYWGRPVPGFGDERPQVWVIGLAPAAHGGNRTGRVFTGDSSGDWLYRAMFHAGFASQPTSRSREDGLQLQGAYVSAICRCAPPDNKPALEEIANCSEYLRREFGLFRSVGSLRVIVCLGGIAFSNALKLHEAFGVALPRPRPVFAHGAEFDLGNAWPRLLASYHPSRQNTNTRRLTEPMLNAVFQRAREIVDQA